MRDNKQVIQPETRYASFSDEALNDMYRESTWSRLDESERLELFQETVNREALKNGGEYSCNVSFDDLASRMAGCQEDGNIHMSREMFVDNQISYKYGNTTIKFDLEDSNYRAYETVLHEHQHVLQERIADGTVKAPDDVKARFEANNFTTTDIDGQRASQYMLGKTGNGYDLYYLNPTELDAFKVSQEKASALCSEHMQKYGSDYSIKAYTEKTAADGYQAKITELRDKYGCDVDKEVETVLINKYQHTNLPVNKNIEQMVTKEMIASQNAIDNLNKTEVNCYMDNKINEHVTKEEYDATLRSSVNSFYEHEMNSPSVSREEAAASTSTMAENYFDAVADFSAQEDNSADFGVSAENDTSVADCGTDTSSGVDDGCCVDM